jgi:short-subunit dehydrogenase
MSHAIEGKWALVTGASSGLGVHFGHELARRKANLVLVARREDRLRELADELRAKHEVETDIVPMDLGTDDAPLALHRLMGERGHDIDVLINNAGFGLHGADRDIAWDRVRAMIQLDIVTLVHLTRLFRDDMIARGRGRILQVASIGAYQPCPNYAAYAAAKAFVASYGEALAHELHGTGVSCTVLSPGVTATEFFDASGQGDRLTTFQRRSMMQPEDVAGIGIEAMLAGRPAVVPGFMNTLNAWMARVIPRRMATAIAGKSTGTGA